MLPWQNHLWTIADHLSSLAPVHRPNSFIDPITATDLKKKGDTTFEKAQVRMPLLINQEFWLTVFIISEWHLADARWVVKKVASSSSGSPINPLWLAFTFLENVSQSIWSLAMNNELSFFAFWSDGPLMPCVPPWIHYIIYEKQKLVQINDSI